MKYFIDVETSGFDIWRNSVISLALIATDDNGNTLGEFYEECAPDVGELAWSKVKGKDGKTHEDAHGFREDDQRKKQSPLSLIINLWKFLNEYTEGKAIPLVQHSDSNFDSRMLWAFLLKNLDWKYYEFLKFIKESGHEDTMRMARKVLDLENYQLPTVATACGLEFENHHHALYDCRYTKDIYFHLLSEHKLSMKAA